MPANQQQLSHSRSATRTTEAPDQQTALPEHIDRRETRPSAIELVQGTNDNATPIAEIKDIVTAIGGFDADVCASSDSVLGKTNYRHRGGLQANWDQYETIYCNHPYATGEPEKWLRKAAQTGVDTTVVTVSRATMSADWFHQHVVGEADIVCFPDERWKFGTHDRTGAFDTVISVYGPGYPRELRDTLTEKGALLVDTDGRNEIRLNTSGTHRNRSPVQLFRHLSRDDQLTVTPAVSAPKRLTDITPLTGHVLTAGYKQATHSPAAHRPFNRDVFEVTFTHRLPSGDDIWVALAASNDAQPVTAAVQTPETVGFEPLSIDEITIPTDQFTTIPPSSGITPRH